MASRRYNPPSNTTSVEYEKNMGEPWFSLIKAGLKKVEGRLNVGNVRDMKKGDYITFRNSYSGFARVMRVRITSIGRYKSFEDYLCGEGLENALPTIDSIEEGIAVYRKYFSEEDEKKYGVAAIRIQVLTGGRR